MWLLLDVDFPYPAFTRLRAKGVKVLHAGDEGLAAYDDRQLLEYAREDDCLIVTRNYAGFARLAEAIVQAVNLLTSVPALLLLAGAGYLIVFEPDQLDALVLLFLDANDLA